MRYLPLVLLLGLLAGCRSPIAGIAGPTATATLAPGKCSMEDREKVSALVTDQGKVWEDAINLASSTPRIQLASQIAELQRIRRAVETQVWPTCAAKVKAILLDMMNETITGFTEFLAQRPADKHFTRAGTLAESLLPETKALIP